MKGLKKFSYPFLFKIKKFNRNRCMFRQLILQLNLVIFLKFCYLW